MNSFRFSRKTVALLTIVCFFGIMELAVLPGPVQAAGAASAVRASDHGGQPQYVVKESASHHARKKPHAHSLLPWIVAGGVVLAAVLVLLLTKKSSSDVTISKFGGHGTTDGLFDHPSGLAIDADGNVYVSDFNNQRIQKFTANGAFIKKWSHTGGMQPMGLTVYGDRLYVCDIKNYSDLQVFDLDGNFIATWHIPDYNTSQGMPGAMDVDTDSSGNIYVVDNMNIDVIVFNSSGTVMRHFSTKSTHQIPRHNCIAISGSQVFLTDAAYSEVNVFDLSGNLLRHWGGEGSSAGKFYDPLGIAVMKGDSVIVGDSNLSPTFSRIQKFDFSGNYQGVIQPAQGGFYARALAVNDKAGKIYVAHGNSDEILVVDTF
jgi:DNA-binding beta-propeller fold protein YncE